MDGSQRRSKLKIRLGVPVAPSRWLERWDGPDQSRMVPTGCFSGRETPHNGAPGRRGNPWPDWTCECVLLHVILTCYLYHCFTMYSSRPYKVSKGMRPLGTRRSMYCRIYKMPNVMLLYSQTVRLKTNIIPYSLML